MSFAQGELDDARRREALDALSAIGDRVEGWRCLPVSVPKNVGVSCGVEPSTW